MPAFRPTCPTRHARNIAAALGCALLLACGGGGGDGDGGGSGAGSGGGGGSDGGTSPAPEVPSQPPAPATVSYSGVETPVQTSTANLPELVSGIVLAPALVSALAEELSLADLEPGIYDDTRSVGGGSATRQGRIADDLTGWIFAEFDSVTVDGETVDGALLLEVFETEDGESRDGRASFYNYSVMDSESTVSVHGSLERTTVPEDEGQHDYYVSDVEIAIEIGDWATAMRLGPGLEVERFSIDGFEDAITDGDVAERPAFVMDGPVYITDLGRLAVTVAPDEPLLFAADPDDPGVPSHPFAGAIVAAEAHGDFPRIRVAGLDRRFGSVEVASTEDAAFTSSVAFRWSEVFPLDLTIHGEASFPSTHVTRVETVVMDEPHRLDGRVAGLDGDGLVQQSWRIISQPPGSDLALDNPDSPTPVLNPQFPGDYVVEQRVTASGQSAYERHRFSVVESIDEPALPIFLHPGLPQGSVSVGDSIALDASLSLRRDGRPLDTLRWTLASTGAVSHGVLSPSQDQLAELVPERPGYYQVFIEPQRRNTGVEPRFAHVQVDPPVDVAPPAELHAHVLATADITGNGTDELVIVNRDAELPLSVFSAGNHSRFGAPEHLEAPADTYSIATGDLTGNGRADLVLRALETLAVYLTGEDGLIAPPVVMPVAGACAWNNDELPGLLQPSWHTDQAVVIADLTGNGIKDLATINHCDGISSSLEVHPGRGDGSFDPPALTSVDRPRHIVAGDITDDGRAELGLIARLDGGGSQHRLHVAFVADDGSATLEAPLAISGVQGGTIAVGDADGSGRTRFVAIPRDRRFEYLDPDEEDGAQRVPFPEPYDASLGDVYSFVFADLNGNGVDDVLMHTQSGMAVSMRDPDTGLQPAIRIPVLPEASLPHGSDRYPQVPFALAVASAGHGDAPVIFHVRAAAGRDNLATAAGMATLLIE